MSHTDVEVLDDGGLQLAELSPIDPWLADPREPLELQEGEVKVCILPFTQSTFYTSKKTNRCCTIRTYVNTM